MATDLSGLYISQSFQNLVQRSASGAFNILATATGTEFIPVSASYAISSSHANDADNAISSSYALTASYLAGVTAQTLQDVTNLGNVTTNNITMSDAGIVFSGSYNSSTQMLRGDLANTNGVYIQIGDGNDDLWFRSDSTEHSMFLSATSSAKPLIKLHSLGSQNAEIVSSNLNNLALYTNEVTKGIKIGNTSTNIHQVTGSLNVLNGITGSLDGNANTATSASHAITSDTSISASHAVNADVAISSSHAVNSDSAISSSHALNADNAISSSHALNADNAISSSYALTASFAENVSIPTLQQVTDVGATTTNAITASGAFINGNAVISGDLDVNGTITYISSSTLQIGDNVIEINYNKAAGNSGIITYDTTSPFTASLLWDATADRWIAGAYGSEETIILAGDTSSMSVANAVSSSHAITSDTSISASHALNADNAISSSYAITSDTSISSSYALNTDIAISSSHALNADVAISSSHAVNSDSAISSSHALNADNAISSSYAVTSSYAENSVPPFPYTGSAQITGSLAITGSAVNNVNTITVASLTSSIDCNLSNTFQFVAGAANTHVIATNINEGQVINVQVTQDVGGAGTLTFDSAFKFPGGTAPTLTATTNAIDLISAVSYDGTTLISNATQNYS